MKDVWKSKPCAVVDMKSTAFDLIEILFKYKLHRIFVVDRSLDGVYFVSAIHIIHLLQKVAVLQENFAKKLSKG